MDAPLGRPSIRPRSLSTVGSNGPSRCPGVTMKSQIARATTHRCFALIALATMLAACSGGGGYSAPPPPPPVMNAVKGQVVDAFVAGATVSAYQVNADGTQGALIATTTTDSSGNYSLNLGAYSGPVYLTS